MEDRDGLTLVLVRPNLDAPGADLLLRSDFTALGIEQVYEARKHFKDAIAAAMDPNGRLATLSDGRIYNPLREIGPRSAEIDAEQAETAKATAEELFRKMDGLTWEEAKRLVTVPLAAIANFKAAGAVGAGVAIAIAVIGSL